MNWLDLCIMHMVNSFANRSWIVDAAMVQLSNNSLLVGGVLMTMVWWAWIEDGKESHERHEVLVSVLGVTAFAVLVARVLANDLALSGEAVT